ncbi:hypothetical protein CHRY9390_02723 [Chryseobacterium aquaeductus]|uniref:Uncharacterized protein n=1 Tax=Chryseobacterium aquaeductus TaxID=2675056 RepID=A0A9N8MQ63_9FLAO|nr:hypothetical protein [Chryseobacterium aquaeductus]CAA7332002.1 hypothetical protein CHRY9390_02723 [Chryseobacterium potabilaquae]CAD7813874.1 hypothetical protein CHRY9390_02723 [Chryseobacterium aquaeductus]
MKLQFSLILCLFFSVATFGQKKVVLSTKDQHAVEHFKFEYKKKNYKRFDGKIVAQNNFILFNDKTIFLDKTDKTTFSILNQGLIYPQLLTEYQMQKFLDETTDKTQKRFLKLQKDPKASFDVNNITVKISELTFLNSNDKIKRFRLTSKSATLPNSVNYLFELTNSKAVKNMNLEEFVKDSKLTYLKQELK